MGWYPPDLYLARLTSSWLEDIPRVETRPRAGRKYRPDSAARVWLFGHIREPQESPPADNDPVKVAGEAPRQRDGALPPGRGRGAVVSSG